MDTDRFNEILRTDQMITGNVSDYRPTYQYNSVSEVVDRKQALLDAVIARA